MPFINFDPADAVAVASTAGEPLTDTGDTLASFVAELKLLQEGRSDVDPARYKKYINYAYQDLCGSLKLEELIGSQRFDTVAGKALYLLPPAIRSTRAVSIVDPTDYVSGGAPLRKRDVFWYRVQADASDDAVTDYFRYGNFLILYPTPASAKSINLEFRVRPDPLVNDDDSPILPIEWHEGILLLADSKFHRAVGEPELALEAENNYIRWVRRKLDLAADEQESQLIIGRPVHNRRQLNVNSPKELDRF